MEKDNTWLEANRTQPFLLLLASHDIHVPRIPCELFQGTTDLGFRSDHCAGGP
jgi:hypothetical protein